MSSSALHQVNNAAKCILFVDAVRLHLLEYDALFWWNSIFGTVAEKAAAAPRMTRATKLEAKIEAEIEAWLGAPAFQDARADRGPAGVRSAVSHRHESQISDIEERVHAAGLTGARLC